MADTIVYGIGHHREWMLQVVSCDCVTGARCDFLAFFDTRTEAETHVEQIVGNMKGRNLIIKIVKIRVFERIWHTGDGEIAENLEKEED